MPKAKAKKPARAMPVFSKAPSEVVEAFRSAVQRIPDVQPRQMFGYPAAFTNTLMFACVFRDAIVLRLSDADREVLRREGGRPFEPMPGRPMREYLAVPAAVRESPPALTSWMTKAHAHTRTLPPKKSKK